jgi:hypothetical protein
MRSYGTTNAAPYASAPAVGPAGDTYWNTTSKVLYVSDGTAWIAPSAAVGDGSITTVKLADAPNSVTTAKVSDLAITTAKLAGGAVTDAKVTDVAYGKITATPLSVQARIQRTTTQSIATGGWTAVICDTVVTNVGSAWSAGNPDYFTVPTTGFYLVGGTAQFMDGAGAGTSRQAAISGPGVVPVYSSIVVKPVGNAAVSICTGAYVTAGTKFYFVLNQDSGAAITIGGYGLSAFWMARVA